MEALLLKFGPKLIEIAILAVAGYIGNILKSNARLRKVTDAMKQAWNVAEYIGIADDLHKEAKKNRYFKELVEILVSHGITLTDSERKTASVYADKHALEMKVPVTVINGKNGK